MFNRFKVYSLVAIMAIFLVAGYAWSNSNSDYSITKTTLGQINQGSGDYSVWITNDNTASVFHFAQDTGIHYPYLPPTSTSQTLTNDQSGTIIAVNNLGGTAPGGIVFTLPTAVVKLDYTLVTDAAVIFRVKPQSADTINWSTNAAGSKVKNTSAAIGDEFEVFCTIAGQWDVKSHSGTWATDNNP